MSERKSSEEIRKVVLDSLHLIAPEVDLESLDPDASLQEEIEIDSMDFLRFMQQLHAELKIDVPEKDAKHLTTLNGCVDYLSAKINVENP